MLGDRNPKDMTVEERKAWLNALKGRQMRRFVFTWNNPTEEVEKIFEKMLDGRACYVVYSHEVGEQGTPHLQGYFETATPRMYGAMLKWYHGWHLEPAYLRKGGNFRYVSKTGADLVEYGVAMDDLKVEKQAEGAKVGGKKEKEKWDEIRLLLQSGQAHVVEVAYPSEYYRYRLRQFEKGKVVPPCKGTNYWNYGIAGTGKSSAAMVYAKTKGWRVYRKLPTIWWDNYDGEEVVLIDEFSKESGHLLNYLKRWTEKAAFSAEIKGGTIQIRPKVFFITSNSRPLDCLPKIPTVTGRDAEQEEYAVIFKGMSSIEQKALLRRFKFRLYTEVIPEDQLEKEFFPDDGPPEEEEEAFKRYEAVRVQGGVPPKPVLQEPPLGSPDCAKRRKTASIAGFIVPNLEANVDEEGEEERERGEGKEEKKE